MRHFSLSATVNELKYLQSNDFLAELDVVQVLQIFTLAIVNV